MKKRTTKESSTRQFSRRVCCFVLLATLLLALVFRIGYSEFLSADGAGFPYFMKLLLNVG